MSLTIFLEGGGQSKDLRTRCREGFRNFLGRLNLPHSPKLVACGSRADAFSRLSTALMANPGGAYLLLVDSEDRVNSENSVWQHVSNRPGDNWDRPANASEKHLHFMAVCMESWLIADPESLDRFYGQGFASSRLPSASDLEAVERWKVFEALRSATQRTSKGKYTKGKASFAALGAVNVMVVREQMPFCARFVDQLTADT
ncbi:MAG: DUF4276 family protein [Phycisphaerales bacterium]|nr:DUF4276 family protein [Phycisphaerales bacterium]